MLRFEFWFCFPSLVFFLFLLIFPDVYSVWFEFFPNGFI